MMGRRRWAPCLVAAGILLCGAAVADAQVAASSGGTYHTNDGSTAAPDITINCFGGVWNSSSHIRLIIPAGLNFTWDNSVGGGALSPISYSGAMAGNMVSPVVVSYANGNKTCVLNIQTTFTPGQAVTIHGLKFKSFGAPCGPLALGAASNGTDTAQYTSAQQFTIVSNPVVTTTPGANQVIDPPPQPGAVTCSNLRITEGNPPGIWTIRGLRISIPNSINLTWDTTMTSVGVTMSPGASGTVSSVISNPSSFEDANKTLVLSVTNFAPGDFVTLSGLRFSPIGADGPAASLFVTTNGSGAFTTGNQASDGFTKQIVGLPKVALTLTPPLPTYTVGDASTVAPTITVTSSAVLSTLATSKITSANGIRLVIPGGLNMSWDTSIQTLGAGLSFGGSGAGHVTAAATKVTYPTAKTALIALQSDFAVNEVLTIDGLKFTSFTAGSAATALTLNTVEATNTTPQTLDIGAPSIASQVGPGGQIFSVDPNPNTTVAAADILVSDDGQSPAVNRITTTGIRIRIPSLPAPTPVLIWDPGVTSVTCSGSAQSGGFMSATAGVTYEDSGMTAVIAVNSNWSGNNLSVLIHGLVFKNLTQPMTPRKLGLSIRGPGGAVCANDLRNLAIGGTPKLDSASDKSFTVSDPVTLAANLKVTDAGGVPTITAVKGIKLEIPSGFPMEWDTTRVSQNTGLGFSGQAFTNLRISTNPAVAVISYPDTKTAIINVTTDFAAGEDLTISGLQFMNFTAPHIIDNLQLFVDPAGAAIPDSKSISIGRPSIALQTDQTFGQGDPSTLLSQVTIQEDASVPRIQSNGIRIHIPAGLNMDWDQTVQTLANGLAFSGTGATHVTTLSATKVTYPTSKIALIQLDTGFAAGEVLQITGLKVMNFSGTSGPLGLGLEVNNSGTICNSSTNTLSTGPRPQIVSITTADSNGNGSIDQIVLLFDRFLDPNTITATTGQGFTISAPSYTIGGASVSGKSITLFLIEKGVPDTGVRPMVSYNASTPPSPGDLQELGTGLETSFAGPQQASDGAAPIITGLSIVDANNNGHIDKVVVTFSETLQTGQEDVLDWKLIDADGTTDLLQSLTNLSIVGNTVQFVLTDAAGTTGTPRFVYVDNPANPKRIQDAAGNVTVMQTNNLPPVIRFAASSIAVGPSKVTLDASASTDPQGQPLTFTWANGSPFTLVNANTATPYFLGTTAGTYVFTVTVSNALSSSTANVNVTIINVPPGADAGSNQTATPGSLVWLVGLGSTDANNDVAPTLTYTWTQLGGISAGSLFPGTTFGEVVGFFAPTPSAPPATPDNILTFELTVSDGVNSSKSRATVRINQSAAVLAPTSDAGPDQVAYTDTDVHLDGSRSFDPSGGTLNYLWTSTTPLTSAATVVNPTFHPMLPGIYTFQLVVTNPTAGLKGFPSTVRVLVQSPGDQAPVAQAHRIQPSGDILIGDEVILDATGSFDPEGLPVTYAWTQVAGPKVILETPNALHTKFTPVRDAYYQFQLIVSDGVNHSLPVTVPVTVTRNSATPTFLISAAYGANIQPNGHALLSVAKVTPLQIVASSSDPASTWFYYLSQTGGPSLNFNQLLFGSPVTFGFKTQNPGYYTFRVSATTGPTGTPVPQGIMAFTTISVVVDDDTVPDYAPIALAAGPTTATAGTLVTLDSSGSTDDNGVGIGAGLKTYWVQKEGPPVKLSDPYGASPTFTPIAPGQYTFELTTMDAKSQSFPSYVVINVEPGASSASTGGSGGGGCGILGLEWTVLLPLVWLASWFRTRRQRIRA